MITQLAQIPTATASEIGAWLVCAAAVMGIIYLGLGIYGFFKRSPSIDVEFVSKKDCEKQHDCLKEELKQIRERQETKQDAIIKKLDELRQEMSAAEERRAREVFGRLKDVETSQARLEGRMNS